MKLLDVYNIQNITISRAKGSFVWDDHGNRYLDLYGGHAVISIGHLHERWQDAMRKQLDEIAFYSNSVHIPQQERLAELLGEISGKSDFRLFLCNSGAEANENAMKLASFHNGRRKVVAFTGAFHGRTSLAVAATDNPSIVAPCNQTDHIIRLPFNDVEALDDCFEKQGREISSVIVEGIQGVGGIREASPEFLQSIRSLCDRYDSVYIADSVQCGYGRTGQFFSHDQAGVEADIYTMAKGMGNGFPVAGIICSQKFEAKKNLLGTTFGGNHLACAAACAVLEVIRDEDLMNRAADCGTYLISKLSAYPQVKAIRGRGLMIGFEMHEPFAEIRKTLLDKKRIFTGEAKGNVVRLLPSLAISRDEADLFLDAFDSIIKQNS